MIDEADPIPSFAFSPERSEPGAGGPERRGFDPSSPEARAAMPSFGAATLASAPDSGASIAVLEEPEVFGPPLESTRDAGDLASLPEPGDSPDASGEPSGTLATRVSEADAPAALTDENVPADFPDLVVIPITDVPATPEIFGPSSKYAPSDIPHLRVSAPAPAPDAPSRAPRSLRLAAAYLLGPLGAALFARGKGRVLWTAASIGTLAAVGLGLARGAELTVALDGARHGTLLFLLLQTVAALGVGGAWAAAIAAAGHRPGARRQRDPRAEPVAWNVALLGFLVPGLGLQLTGHPKRAAAAFSLLGPLAAALIILGNASWLWESTHANPGAGPGISESSLEVVFATAAVFTAATALAWVVQALDAARRASGRGSGAFSSMASLALLASLAIFAFTFRPPAIASYLHATASDLRHEGLQRIPLALTEVATRLDPAEPAYLAQAVELQESLGQPDRARSTRALLERRAQEYSQITRRGERVREAGFLPMALPRSTATGEGPVTRNELPAR